MKAAYRPGPRPDWKRPPAPLHQGWVDHEESKFDQDDDEDESDDDHPLDEVLGESDDEDYKDLVNEPVQQNVLVSALTDYVERGIDDIGRNELISLRDYLPGKIVIFYLIPLIVDWMNLLMLIEIKEDLEKMKRRRRKKKKKRKKKTKKMKN